MRFVRDKPSHKNGSRPPSFSHFLQGLGYIFTAIGLMLTQVMRTLDGRGLLLRQQPCVEVNLGEVTKEGRFGLGWVGGGGVGLAALRGSNEGEKQGPRRCDR